MNRRSFLQHSATAAAGTALAAALPLEVAAAPFSAKDKFRVGLIGANGMGWKDMTAFLKVPGVECTAIADVDQSVLDRRAADAETIQGFRPQLFKDYRRLLDLKDIDAVIIGSPDHWHCLHFCDSLAAGKHVYCEKPLGRTIRECKAMLAAAARNPQKMVQINQWQRSGPHYASALELVKGGKLGKIRLVKAWSYVGWKKPIEFKPDGPVPDGVDYDMWLGPAPKRPFNPNRFHFEFRWFWDYAGGLMTDWGVHQLDIAFEGPGLKTPKSVMASGGKFGYPGSAAETPDTLQAIYEYESCNVLWEHILGISGGPFGRTEGIAFVGNDGTLVIDRNNWSILPESQKGDDGLLRYKTEKLPDQVRPATTEYLDFHVQNFLDCIHNNTREKLNCGIETAANVAINCCIGNIAQQLGRKVFWDAGKGQFRDDREADRLADAVYHNGWELPS